MNKLNFELNKEIKYYEVSNWFWGELAKWTVAADVNADYIKILTKTTDKAICVEYQNIKNGKKWNQWIPKSQLVEIEYI